MKRLFSFLIIISALVSIEGNAQFSGRVPAVMCGDSLCDRLATYVDEFTGDSIVDFERKGKVYHSRAFRSKKGGGYTLWNMIYYSDSVIVQNGYHPSGLLNCATQTNPVTGYFTRSCWHENGNLKSYEHSAQGDSMVVMYTWHTTGELIGEYQLKNREVVSRTTYNLNGTLFDEFSLEPHKIREYDHQGRLFRDVKLINDTMSVEFFFYPDDGYQVLKYFNWYELMHTDTLPYAPGAPKARKMD